MMMPRDKHFRRYYDAVIFAFAMPMFRYCDDFMPMAAPLWLA